MTKSVIALIFSLVWLMIQIWLYFLAAPLDVQRISFSSAVVISLVIGVFVYVAWLDAFKEDFSIKIARFISVTATLVFCIYVWMSPFYVPVLYRELGFSIQRMQIDAARCERLEGIQGGPPNQADRDYVNFVCRDKFGKEVR